MEYPRNRSAGLHVESCVLIRPKGRNSFEIYSGNPFGLRRLEQRIFCHPRSGLGVSFTSFEDDPFDQITCDDRMTRDQTGTIGVHSRFDPTVKNRGCEVENDSPGKEDDVKKAVHDFSVAPRI